MLLNSDVEESPTEVAGSHVSRINRENITLFVYIINLEKNAPLEAKGSWKGLF